MGGNSLTPRYACKTLNQDLHKDLVNQYDKTYLDDILSRWLLDNPGLDLSADQVSSLFLWCAFEINVRGILHSAIYLQKMNLSEVGTETMLVITIKLVQVII